MDSHAGKKVIIFQEGGMMEIVLMVSGTLAVIAIAASVVMGIEG